MVGGRLISDVDFDRDRVRLKSETNRDSDWLGADADIVRGSDDAEGLRTSIVLELQSMGGLTRSSQGIPKMMEWEPIGPTRKVSRCLTFAMVYDKVAWRVAWVSNAPFAKLTAVGVHGVVLRDSC